MVEIELAEARMAELIDLVAAGETVCITRQGAPIANLTPILQKKRPVDVASLRALTDAQPLKPIGAGEFIRQMRDSDRY